MLSRLFSHSLIGSSSTSLLRSLAQVVHITDENFQDVVLDSKKPVIVDFFANWCGPCKMLGPLIEAEAAKSGDEIVVAKIDVDENPQSAMDSMVTALPTVISFHKGEAKDRFVGLVPQHILADFFAKTKGLADE
uniref:Thioredoxin 2 n=1 Tax=Stygiella incarcerata TaxID=1712417 RepID=A0A192ZID5_9EUKA|nr:thioredoxin 2 [Stygiella incarcerata]|eukprot:TRINITY_DN1880_c0_g1_i1.p2 TRINITY_DN1880_c0_g1~~TRINITY_DN1880_c0_g1_i1.p2  ORF type:complete len:134 (+),score=34.68 TRINITY_DN1880_c0_g1_i1:132-533(+)